MHPLALAESDAELMTMVSFLESCPPNKDSILIDLGIQGRLRNSSVTGSVLNTPEITLHCSDDICNGDRIFRCVNDPINITSKFTQSHFITYRCSNCRKTTKTYSFTTTGFEDEFSGKIEQGKALKVGEIPPFGPPTPSRLLKLIGPDRDLFLKGRRCENQGLGIGAFVYYRRVVENQKNRIISEVIKVANKVGATDDQIKDLTAAQNETQFTKSLEMVKGALPQSLMIDGHNPLLLLHSALSEGVHIKTDSDCLEIASNVRIVLAELSDRLSMALKEEAELNHAISKLVALRNKG